MRMLIIATILLTSSICAPPMSYAHEKIETYKSTEKTTGLVDYAIMVPYRTYDNAATAIITGAREGQTTSAIMLCSKITPTVEVKAKATVEPGGDRYKQVENSNFIFDNPGHVAYKIQKLHIDPGLKTKNQKNYINIFV